MFLGAVNMALINSTNAGSVAKVLPQTRPSFVTTERKLTPVKGAICEECNVTRPVRSLELFMPYLLYQLTTDWPVNRIYGYGDGCWATNYHSVTF